MTRNLTQSLVDRMIRPVNINSLQGSPESGRPWEAHCNKTVMFEPLNFKMTTHDKTIHHAECKSETTHMLRQVNNFSLACNNKLTAVKTHNITGSKLRPPDEGKDPFAHLGLVKDFSGINMTQAKRHVKPQL